MIRHALLETRAVRLLSLAVIEPRLLLAEAVLVASARLSPRSRVACLAARLAAVPVASIVALADEEDARAETARAHPENLFFLHVPARPAGLGAGQLRGDVRTTGRLIRVPAERQRARSFYLRALTFLGRLPPEPRTLSQLAHTGESFRFVRFLASVDID